MFLGVHFLRFHIKSFSCPFLTGHLRFERVSRKILQVYSVYVLFFKYIRSMYCSSSIFGLSCSSSIFAMCLFFKYIWSISCSSSIFGLCLVFFFKYIRSIFCYFIHFFCLVSVVYCHVFAGRFISLSGYLPNVAYTREPSSSALSTLFWLLGFYVVSTFLSRNYGHLDVLLTDVSRSRKNIMKRLSGAIAYIRVGEP